MHLDRWNREIQEGDYAMLLYTSWQSNDINIKFVLVTRLTEKRLHYIMPHMQLLGRIQETWTASHKLIIVSKEMFIEGLVRSEVRHIAVTRELSPTKQRQLIEEALEEVEQRFIYQPQI